MDASSKASNQQGYGNDGRGDLNPSRRTTRGASGGRGSGRAVQGAAGCGGEIRGRRLVWGKAARIMNGAMLTLLAEGNQESRELLATSSPHKKMIRRNKDRGRAGGGGQDAKIVNGEPVLTQKGAALPFHEFRPNV